MCLAVPGAPRVLPDECSAENNTVTLAWRPQRGATIDGFVLELDDGSGGAFRVSQTVNSQSLPLHCPEAHANYFKG